MKVVARCLPTAHDTGRVKRFGPGDHPGHARGRRKHTPRTTGNLTVRPRTGTPVSQKWPPEGVLGETRMSAAATLPGWREVREDYETWRKRVIIDAFGQRER
jgi:hypothetical protein